jgi:Na+/H+-dicarboxylate symporter
MTDTSLVDPNIRPPSKSRFPLAAQIALGMGLGLVVGPWAAPYERFLSEVARLVIQGIKGAATPLLFLSIVVAVAQTNVSVKAGGRLVGFALVNTSIALLVGLLLTNVFEPGNVLGRALANNTPEGAAQYAGKRIDFVGTLAGYVPTDVVTPFANNAVISVVILAVLLGAGIRSVRRDDVAGVTHLTSALDALLQAVRWVLTQVTRLVPFAVFCSVARTIAQHGYAPLAGLGVYVVMVLLGLGIHVALTFHGWLVVYAKMSLRDFWRAAREPVVYALGTNSSLATLPLTLNALGRLNVSPAASALGACVGTNLNNDGIVLYEGMAFLMIAQALGIPLSLGDQLLAAICCVVAAMGVAGIPEAGFISLALVLNTVGLPVDVLPLLLGVDWVVARARSAVNVLSDMLLSILVDRSGVDDLAVSPEMNA